MRSGDVRGDARPARCVDVEEVRSSILLAPTPYRCRSRRVQGPGGLRSALEVVAPGSNRPAFGVEESCVHFAAPLTWSVRESSARSRFLGWLVRVEYF
jgi:hypothetical protein